MYSHEMAEYGYDVIRALTRDTRQGRVDRKRERERERERARERETEREKEREREREREEKRAVHFTGIHRASAPRNHAKRADLRGESTIPRCSTLRIELPSCLLHV